jgi:hypothetical protein
MESKFDLDFIQRTLRTSGVVLLICLVFGFYYFGKWPALGFFSGGVWGMVNLLLITSLVKLTIRPEGADITAALITGLVKFPLLYVSGYFLLKVEQFEPLHLLYGFSTILVVIVLKAIGRVMLGLDGNGNDEHVQKVV